MQKKKIKVDTNYVFVSMSNICDRISSNENMDFLKFFFLKTFEMNLLVKEIFQALLLWLVLLSPSFSIISSADVKKSWDLKLKQKFRFLWFSVNDLLE